MGFLDDDQRAVSELVGSVFIIGLTVVMAVVVVALAGGAIQAVGDETQDSLTNDAFYEMDGRINGLVTSQVDASTEFRFPEGATVNPMPNEGNITVNASVTSSSHQNHTVAPRPWNATNFTVGTIVYEDRHGQSVVYQGGGLWQFASEDYTNLRSSPPFDYDGKRINFQFVNVSDITSVTQGQEVAVSKNAAQSRNFSNKIRNAISPQWSIDEGSGFTVPVDVNVTIESKFARAWKVYAEEQMRERPDTIDFNANENLDTKANVTLVFEGIGGSDLPDYPGPILYAGEAAKAPNLFDPFGNGTINSTGENEFEIEHNTGPHQQQQQLAFYDKTEGEWMIHMRNGGQPPQNNNAWYNVSETVGGPGDPVYPDDTLPPQIEGFSSDSSDDTHTYDINDSYASMPVCVVAYNGTNIQASNDYGVVEHLEQCAINLDVDDPGEYMPTSLEANITTNVTDPVLGESKKVAINVSNVGAIESVYEHDVALYHEIGGELVLADYATSNSIGPIDAGDSRTVNMSWTPRDPSTDAIHAVVGVHDADRQNVSVNGRNIDLSVDIADDTDDTVGLGGQLAVNATVNNTGNVDLAGTNVVLREEDGTPVDRTQITLDTENETGVTLNWTAPLEDFDETLEVQALGANDTHTVVPSGSANFDVDIDGVSDPASSNQPLNVTATIENTGDASGTQEILLIADTERVDELIADTIEVDLDEGEQTRIDLTWDSPAEPVRGDNDVIVRSRDDSDRQGFDVEASYQIDIDDVSPSVVNEGGRDVDVSVDASVTNLGDAAGSQRIELGVPDGSDLQLSSTDSEHVDVSGGATESITLYGAVDADDSLTGNLSVSSEDDLDRERVIMDREGPDCWDGDVSYDGSGTTNDPYQISTVDELQCLDWHMWEGGHDVGSQYVLTEDIDAYGTQYWNDGDGFVPIAEQNRWGRHFQGDFDGQGHKIEGLTIDRPDEPFVGLFAATHYFEGGGGVGHGVTIENVELVDIDVHGKTVVGGLVGGAGGSIERVSVSGHVESEYQQVGGLVGHAHDADLNNELVSHATVEGGFPAGVDGEHPWEDTNLGIGGIVGGTGYNTDIATAYSTATVTGNSAVGGITGWTSDYDSTNEQMYWVGGHVELVGDRRLGEYPVDRRDLDLDPAAGAIAGRMELGHDNFEDSVYSDENYRSIGEQEADADDIARAPSEMVGPQVLPDSEAANHPGITTDDTEGTMANLDWDIWEPVYDINETGEIVNEGYPVFAWEVEGAFVVDDIEAPDEVTEGDTVTVNATIANTKDETDTQDIRLFNPEGNPVAVTETTLDADETRTVPLEWNTRVGDNTTNLTDPTITVQSDDSGNAQSLDILPLEAPEFSVLDVSAPNSANATDQVNVTADIENGGGPGSQTVFLEHENGQVLDSVLVDLDEGGQTEATLTWFTQMDDDGDDQTLSVETLDGVESTTVDIDEAAVSDFEIQNVTFPEFDDGETPVVTAGESITAEVTIENEGGAASTDELVWLTPAGAPEILDHNETTLDPGQEVTFNLTWETTSPDVDVLEVYVEGENPIAKPILVQHSQDGAVADPIDVDLSLINRAG